ncbi:UNVERIFIED_CONTAM: hypothetical protein GTU68_062488 [Idotea baltica]|nr:hypothetical protein [Idotea baltica]
MKKILLSTAAAGILISNSAFSVADDNTAWGYTGKIGPEHWGDLSESWSTCSTGTSQSPIDIVFETPSKDNAITTNYNETGISVLNNGHTIQQNYDAGSTLKSGGGEYDLVQFHFHSPSEHTFNGEHFPLEVHLVHADKQGNLAVVGVMFEEGAANQVVEKVWETMPDTANTTASSDQMLNAKNLLPKDMNFALYSGSLTTPPCSEGVRWHVVKQPLTVSDDQISKFKSILHDNNRPVLPLNGRKVETISN